MHFPCSSLFIVSCRLSLGWIWEEFVITLIEYICEADNLTSGVNLLIRLLALFIIVCVSYLMHRWIRPWDGAYDRYLEEQKEQSNAQPAADTTNPMTAQQMDRD